MGAELSVTADAEAPGHQYPQYSLDTYCSHASVTKMAAVNLSPL